MFYPEGLVDFALEKSFIPKLPFFLLHRCVQKWLFAKYCPHFSFITLLKQQNLFKNDCKSDLIMIITLITTYEFLYTGCSIWIFPILNSFENCQIYPFFYHENYLMHYGEGENDRYVPIPK